MAADLPLAQSHPISSLAPATPRLIVTANIALFLVGVVVLTMPVQPADPTVIYADFYWLDMPATAPPYHTFATGTLSADGSTFETTAPAITGHAAVVLKTIFKTDLGVASSCTGFQNCVAEPDNQTIGPVFVEVVP